MLKKKQKKNKGYSNIKIENRMPTHRMNIRIFWSSPNSNRLRVVRIKLQTVLLGKRFTEKERGMENMQEGCATLMTSRWSNHKYLLLKDNSNSKHLACYNSQYIGLKDNFLLYSSREEGKIK